MPLIKHWIQPTDLSRGAVAQGIRNELECVTNNTLANVIRQLSSLSSHAEDMFSELFTEASKIFDRANNLQERVDRLQVKVTQLDSTVEEVSLQDINMRKPFKSSVKKDQQVITMSTRPRAILQMYKDCDAPPALDKLNPYREDGKDSMKFYTDPTYFFELWCSEMQKDTEMQKKELKKKRNKRPKGQQQRGPPKVREIKTRKDEYKNMAMGQEFIPHNHENQARSPQDQDSRSPSRPNSLEVQSGNFMANQGYPQGYGQSNYQQQQYAYSNGPITNAGEYEEPYEGEAPPQYQGPPPYSNHNQQQHDNQMNYANDMTSPIQSPGKRGTPGSGSRTPANSIGSPRPSQPPPAPPGMGSRSGSASRESLPPPPPPPPGETQSAVRGTPPYSSPNSTPGQTPRLPHVNHVQRESPVRAGTPHSHTTKSSTPDSIDLPPPPPPPPLSQQTPDTPGSMSSMPPPPPTPPPPEISDAAPPPPPLPPPPPPMNFNSGGQGDKMPNGNLSAARARTLMPAQVDSLSIASNGSSATVSSGSTNKSEEKAPIKDERSDLLAAIRTGIQLRRVEERRVKEEQKKQPVGGLDVQSIMEAAFEMRRKALEADDEEDEEEDSDVVWDSEEEC